MLMAAALEEFVAPTPSSEPSAIVAAPDGNLWFAMLGSSAIGRITTEGDVTEFSFDLSTGGGSGIAVGPDGGLWFTRGGDDGIGRINTDGDGRGLITLPPDSAAAQPFAITAGPDGRLWFTGRNGIGRIDGSFVTPLNAPFETLGTRSITAGPDGNLWFTILLGNPRIGRVTPEGAFTPFDLPSDPPLAVPNVAQGITAGPDGALWFTAGANIGRISTDGAVSAFPLPSGLASMVIAAGADGNLWFTASDRSSPTSAGRIGRITPGGVVTQFAVPSGDPELPGIAAGPDGNIWFTERGRDGTGRVGRVDLGDLLASTGRTIDAAPGVPSSGPVATFTAAALGAIPGDFDATIDWGDGGPASIGTVAADGLGGFEILASHTYASRGTFPIVVSIADGGGATAAASGTARVGIPPTVASLRRLGYHAGPTRLVLTFDAPIDPDRASDLANYRLDAPGPDRRFGTRDDRAIPLLGASYEDEVRAVTLAPVDRLPLRRTYRLTVVGIPPNGLTSPSGTPLDGSGTGLPGTDYTATFGPEILEPPAPITRAGRLAELRQQFLDRRALLRHRLADRASNR